MPGNLPEYKWKVIQVSSAILNVVPVTEFITVHFPNFVPQIHLQCILRLGVCLRSHDVSTRVLDYYGTTNYCRQEESSPRFAPFLFLHRLSQNRSALVLLAELLQLHYCRQCRHKSLSNCINRDDLKPIKCLAQRFSLWEFVNRRRVICNQGCNDADDAERALDHTSRYKRKLWEAFTLQGSLLVTEIKSKRPRSRKDLISQIAYYSPILRLTIAIVLHDHPISIETLVQLVTERRHICLLQSDSS